MAKHSRRISKRTAAPRRGVANVDLRKSNVKRVFAALDKVDATEPSAEAALATASQVAVIFRCDDPACLVGISVASMQFAFFESQGVRLPAGTHRLGWKVSSTPPGRPFNVTVEGATLNDPIQGMTGPNSGGLRRLTV